MRKKMERLKGKGQGLVEYALILIMVAIIVVVILGYLGTKLNNTFSKIGSGIG